MLDFKAALKLSMAVLIGAVMLACENFHEE